MADFKDRLISERDELLVKTKKLGDFLKKGSLDDKVQLALLNAQYDVMNAYVTILNNRLTLL